MAAPKFSFVVETQQTRAQKGQRGPIVSIIRSHLAYRQHNKRKAKVGERQQDSASNKPCISKKKLCQHRMSHLHVSQAEDIHIEDGMDRGIAPCLAASAKRDFDYQRLDPFAMENYLDEDELLKSFHEAELDAEYHPRQTSAIIFPTEPSPLHDILLTDTSSCAFLGSPDSCSPQMSTGFEDLTPGTSPRMGFGHDDLIYEEPDTNTDLQMAQCLRQDYNQKQANSQTNLLDDWSEFPYAVRQPQNNYTHKIPRCYEPDHAYAQCGTNSEDALVRPLHYYEVNAIT